MDGLNKKYIQMNRNMIITQDNLEVAFHFLQENIHLDLLLLITSWVLMMSQWKSVKGNKMKIFLALYIAIEQMDK